MASNKTVSTLQTPPPMPSLSTHVGQDFFELASDCSLILDDQGLIQAVSKNGKLKLGDLIDKQQFDALWSANSRKLVAQALKTLGAGQKIQLDNLTLKKSVSDVCYSLTLIGSKQSTLALINDTTKQHAASELQNVEHSWLISIMKQAPVMIALVESSDCVLRMANKYFRDTFAIKREHIGQSLKIANPNLARSPLVKLAKNALKSGQSQMLKEVNISQGPNDQSERYFNLICQPAAPSGTISPAVFVYAIEITEQVTARKAAEAYAALQEAILASLPDGFYIGDLEGMLKVNELGAKLLGYDSPDVIPSDINQIIDHGDIRLYPSNKPMKKQQSALGQAIKGRRIQQDIIVTNPHTKQPMILRSSASPIVDTDGKIIGAVAINADMTETVRLQSELAKHSAEQTLLNQKTAMLKEQNEILTNLNNSKDEFLALASHQLRTPATGVKQYLGMLIEGYGTPLAEDQWEMVSKAYEINDRQIQIIEDMLLVAKIDTGTVVLNKQPCSLSELLDMIIAESRPRAAAHQQTIIYNNDIPNVMITVDINMIRMAIENIIDNALKYSLEDTNVTISVYQSGSSVQIDITDQGVGIAKKDIPKLFRKFVRLDNLLSIQAGGTGLGLYWAGRVMTLHNGTITVTSKTGKGSTFTVTLPV